MGAQHTMGKLREEIGKEILGQEADIALDVVTED